nr:olfactory receptor 10V1-like [Odocoileus virginianus texanus]
MVPVQLLVLEAFLLLDVGSLAGNAAVFSASGHSVHTHSRVLFLTDPATLLVSLGCADCILVETAAYDGFEALRDLLRHTLVMKRQLRTQLAVGALVLGFVPALQLTAQLFHLSFCGHNRITHLCCDALPIWRVARGDTQRCARQRDSPGVSTCSPPRLWFLQDGCCGLVQLRRGASYGPETGRCCLSLQLRTLDLRNRELKDALRKSTSRTLRTIRKPHGGVHVARNHSLL